MVVSEVCVECNGTQLMENLAVTGLQADSIDCCVPFLLRDQRSDPSGGHRGHSKEQNEAPASSNLKRRASREGQGKKDRRHPRSNLGRLWGSCSAGRGIIE